VDLAGQRVTAGDLSFGFDIDPFLKHCLLEGLDEVALTLTHAAEIAAFEERRPCWLPVIAGD